MDTRTIADIDLGKLADDLSRYENQWIAVSRENKIVSSGATYAEAVARARGADTVLFKVPPLDVSLAP